MASAWIHPHCPVCDTSFEIECEIEPGEWYGADADGNRGMWVGPRILTPETPDKCDNEDCPAAAGYDEDQLDELTRRIERKMESWEPPEPDYDSY